MYRGSIRRSRNILNIAFCLYFEQQNLKDFITRPPQDETEDDFEWAERNAARTNDACRLYLQPEWSRFDSVIAQTVEYVKAHPKWNISIQTHKYMRIP